MNDFVSDSPTGWPLSFFGTLVGYRAGSAVHQGHSNVCIGPIRAYAWGNLVCDYEGTDA